MKHFTVRADAELKQFLASALNISKGKAKELIDTRNVFVNDHRVWIATHRLHRGDQIEIGDSALQERKRAPKFSVLYEDDFIIAVNKPPLFISDQDPNSVEAILRRTRNSPALQAIHRLDKDTSGVYLLAKNNAAFEKYKQIWRVHGVQKRYFAICFNKAQFEETEVRLPVDGRNAVSEIKLLKNSHGFCYLQIDTATGRKHQIRIHLNTIHHPIVGDKQYGVRVITDNLIKGVSRQMLHCARIVLPGPDPLPPAEGVTPEQGDSPGRALREGSLPVPVSPLKEDRAEQLQNADAVASQTRQSRTRPLQITAPLFDDFRRLGQRLGLIPH